MDDLISRQAAVDTIRNIKAITGTHDDEILLIDKAQAQTELMMLPSAEPERKKGKWIHDNPNTFRCSECNKYLGISCGNMKMNFCPNCEADMREGEQE